MVKVGYKLLNIGKETTGTLYRFITSFFCGTILN